MNRSTRSDLSTIDARPQRQALIREPSRLPQVVGDDHPGHLPSEAPQRLFHPHRRRRVQRCAGLVEQQDLRLQRECSRQAQTLHLPSGERRCRAVQPIGHFLPEGRLPQRALDPDRNPVETVGPHDPAPAPLDIDPELGVRALEGLCGDLGQG